MEFKKILVTPSLAAQYLEANISNRRIRENTVSRYVKDILNGRWKQDTGECIKISKNGVILDGQHRLAAVVKSKTAVFFHIAFDVDDSVFSVLDTGSVRNASDCFKIKGIKNETVLPSIMSFYYALKKGTTVKGIQKNDKMTNDELIDEYYKDVNKWQIVAQKSLTWYNNFAKILAPSFLGGFYAKALEIDSAKANEFMNMLCTGDNITNNSISLLRQKLIKDKISLKKLSVQIKLAFVIKVWNYYIEENHSIKIIKFNPEAEDFPKMSSGK